MAQSAAFTVSVSSAFPSWYPSSAGQVVSIPTSSTTIGTATRADGANSYPGTDPDNIVAPWCGGALVYVSGQPYLIAYGGGHGDSAYNGIVKFGPLFGAGSDTPTWTTFLSGSGAGTAQNGGTYSGGRQGSNHTYNNIVGVGDTLYSMATDAFYSNGGATNLAFKFTPSGQTSIAANTTRGPSAYGAAVHINGNIYYTGSADQFHNLGYYNIAGNNWTSVSGTQHFFSLYVAGAADTTRNALLMVGSNQGIYWPNPQSSTGRLTGRAVPSSYAYSLEYDPDRDAFVSWVSGSLTVRELSASSLASGGNPSWTNRTFTGTTPSSGVGAGTYGRFRYVPQLKGYVVAPNIESGVFFYRSA